MDSEKLSLTFGKILWKVFGKAPPADRNQDVPLDPTLFSHHVHLFLAKFKVWVCFFLIKNMYYFHNLYCNKTLHCTANTVTQDTSKRTYKRFYSWMLSSHASGKFIKEKQWEPRDSKSVNISDEFWKSVRYVILKIPPHYVISFSSMALVATCCSIKTWMSKAQWGGRGLGRCVPVAWCFVALGFCVNSLLLNSRKEINVLSNLA